MKRFLIIAASVAAIAGCGTAAAPKAAPPATPQAQASPGPSATSAVNYGQQYLADVAPFNAAVKGLNASATSVTDPTAVALREAAVTFSRALLQQQWPAGAQADVHALAIASAKLASDLLDDTALATNMYADATTADADAQAVRADLGLPAPGQS